MKLAPFFVVGSAAAAFILSNQTAVIEPDELRKTIEGMGFEVKNLNEEKGKEKFEFTMKKPGFDVPMAAEISASKNYIWFTVFLGKASDSAERHSVLLKENHKVQPDFFYITEKGNLMLGVAVDNRGVTPAVVKRITDKLSDDVVNTAKLWQ